VWITEVYERGEDAPGDFDGTEVGPPSSLSRSHLSVAGLSRLWAARMGRAPPRYGEECVMWVSYACVFAL